MSIGKLQLKRALGHELNGAGFFRKSTTWWLDEGNILKVVNLQKSSFSALYYVNLAIHLKDLDDARFPKEEKCHIRIRMSNAVANDAKDFSYLFDLENMNLSYDEYEMEMKQCVRTTILPQLETMSSREGLLRIIEGTPAILNAIPLVVKAYYRF